MPGSNTVSKENPAHETGVELARLAAGGNRDARSKVNALAHPMITYQSDRFCKRFCAENKYLYRCTLQKPWGNPPQDALLCEWGNASYAWMLNDLTSEQRLEQFKGENGARLQDYLFRIANSMPFYERWKNWRFGRRVHVPDYIKDISPEAARIFLAMRSQDNIAHIAQNLNLPETYTDDVAQKIILTLTKRKKLYLLNPDREQSISGSSRKDNDAAADEFPEDDIAVRDIDPEQQEYTDSLRDAWSQLTVTEQFVLEAMLIEEQDANDVLAAIKKLEIQLNPKIAPRDTDRQQLYYFKRKSLARLTSLMESNQ